MSTDPVDYGRMLAEGRFEEFLVHLRMAAVRAEDEAARRPSWEQLAVELLALRELLDDKLFAGERHPLSPMTLHPPTQESWLQREVDELADRHLNRSHTLLLQQLGAYAAATSDHLRGLAALMLVEPPVRPAMAIGRVLLDAATHLAYLLEQGISVKDRSIRAANVRLDGLCAERNDLPAGHTDTHSERLDAEIDELYQQGAADSLPRQVDRRGRVQRYFAPPLIKTEDMTALVLGDVGRMSWRTLSSVVHAQDRSLVAFTSGRGPVRQHVQGRRYGALQIAPCVLAGTEVIKQLAVALGLESLALTMQANRLMHVWAVAGGLRELPD